MNNGYYPTRTVHATAVSIETVPRVLIGLELEVFGRGCITGANRQVGIMYGPYCFCDGRMDTGRVLRVFSIITLPPLCHVRIHSGIIDARH